MQKISNYIYFLFKRNTLLFIVRFYVEIFYVVSPRLFQHVRLILMFETNLLECRFLSEHASIIVALNLAAVLLDVYFCLSFNPFAAYLLLDSPCKVRVTN